MGKYLKKFETQSAYEAAQSSLILPNVSLTVDNNTVHYNPNSPTPPTPTHDYVEIGGVKWATMNIGANSVTDGGLYFAWAETSGYTAAQVGTDKNFEESDNKYYDNGYYTKYNNNDGLITLQSGDDAVTAAWGGSWRTPTTSEWQALGDSVNAAWTSDYQGSGVSGLVCTDKTDSSKVLFFPAVGDAEYGTVYGDVEYGYGSGNYWSNSLNLDSEYSDSAYGMYFTNSEYDAVSWNTWIYRCYGASVRGILDE